MHVRVVELLELVVRPRDIAIRRARKVRQIRLASHHIISNHNMGEKQAQMSTSARLGVLAVGTTLSQESS